MGYIKKVEIKAKGVDLWPADIGLLFTWSWPKTIETKIERVKLPK